MVALRLRRIRVLHHSKMDILVNYNCRLFRALLELRNKNNIVVAPHLSGGYSDCWIRVHDFTSDNQHEGYVYFRCLEEEWPEEEGTRDALYLHFGPYDYNIIKPDPEYVSKQKLESVGSKLTSALESARFDHEVVDDGCVKVFLDRISAKEIKRLNRDIPEGINTGLAKRMTLDVYLEREPGSIYQVFA